MKKDKKRQFHLTWLHFLLLLSAAVGIGFAVKYFFFGETEEDRVRKVFAEVCQLVEKSKPEGAIVSAVSMQKLSSYFCDPAHISIHELSWMNGDLGKETLIAHAFRGRSMFKTMSLSFSIEKVSIMRETATVLFSVHLSGVLRSGNRISETRDFIAELSSASGRWQFQSCRTNDYRENPASL